MAQKAREFPGLLRKILSRVLPSLLIFQGILALFALLSWLTQGHSILDSIYWSTIVGYTVGFGDILPANDFGKIMCIIMVPIKAMLFTIVAGHIFSIINENRQSELMSEVQALVDHFGIVPDYTKDGK